jgi:pyruvate dehydrogenase kinase 2/3/4
VTIKVSDEGGGIARSGLASIWTYLYSTAKSRVQMEQLQVRISNVGPGLLSCWFS